MQVIGEWHLQNWPNINIPTLYDCACMYLYCKCHQRERHPIVVWRAPCWHECGMYPAWLSGFFLVEILLMDGSWHLQLLSLFFPTLCLADLLSKMHYIGPLPVCIPVNDKNVTVIGGVLNTCEHLFVQIKNIAMEILDFYDNYRQIPEDRINQALSKLPQRS